MTEVEAWEIYSAEIVAAAKARGGNTVRAEARKQADDRYRVNRLAALSAIADTEAGR